MANFSLIADDILQVDLDKVFRKNDVAMPAKLVGNLPYNISTAITQRVIDARELFSSVVFMFKTRGRRAYHRPAGDSERGFFTVIVEASLKARAFSTCRPKHFRRGRSLEFGRPAYAKPRSSGDEPEFRKLVSHAFAQKRKTLLNNLKHTVANAEAVLTAAGIDPRRRAETLTLAEWHKIADSLK